MANPNDISVTLGNLGFELAGVFRYGTWKNYSLLLQMMGNRLNIIAAVQLPKGLGTYRRELKRSLKEKGMKSLALAGLTGNAATFLLSFGKAENMTGFLTESLNAVTAVLRESGVNPPNICALSGAGNPDSLCLVSQGGALSYRPVCAAAVRDRDAQTREKIEDNQANGSYALGFVGALLGMLVGLIPNLLSIMFVDTIWSLLFALVPLCAMFGYKLFKGKMNKGSVVIVVALSLLAVFLIPTIEILIYLVKDYGAPLGSAMGYTLQIIRDPEFFSNAGSEYLQLLLFMALGIWIAWRYISGQTNSSQALSSETQLATLRPNPAHEE